MTTEIPIPVMFPNICVLDEADLPRAKELISVYFQSSPMTESENWTCPNCGESIEAHLANAGPANPAAPKARSINLLQWNRSA